MIAEICYQIALRGGRTLIASQSNLAVDNALDRLIHNPSIRAVRKGTLASVEEEGRDFTEERVVQTWLTHTAQDCQEKLGLRHQTIALLRTILQDTQRFSEYHQRELRLEHDQYSFQQHSQEIDQEINEREANIIQSAGEIRKYAPLQQTFSAILSATIDWKKPNLIETLKNAFQFLGEVSNKQQFIMDLNDCLRIMQEVRLAPRSNGHLLESLNWLRESTPIYQKAWSGTKTLLDQVEDILAEQSKLEQQQRDRETSLQSKKTHLVAIDKQIARLQSEVDSHNSAIRALQGATQTLRWADQRLDRCPA